MKWGWDTLSRVGMFAVAPRAQRFREFLFESARVLAEEPHEGERDAGSVHVHPAEHHLSEGHDAPCAHSTSGSWHTSTQVRPRSPNGCSTQPASSTRSAASMTGSTQTDTLALERQRGITIRSAVVSFVIDDVTVNLIDTPGPPGLHRGGRARPARARRRRAGRVRRGGRAGADADPDANAAASAHPDAHLREQDRPRRGDRRRGPARHRRQALTGDRRDGNDA